MEFYTYLWLREDGTPYYVGKGVQRRAFRKGAPPRERIITQSWPDEESAFAAECFLIEYYGRKDLKEGCLINLTNGGEGASGWKPSEQTRCRLHVAMLGDKNPFFNKEHTAATRAVWSEKRKGRSTAATQTAAASRKRKATHTKLGAPWFRTTASLRAQREAMAAKRGYKHTAASIELMREKAKAMWARRKQV